MGYEKHYRALVDCRTIVTADRVRLGCYGLNGGKAGQPFCVTIDAEGSPRDLGGLVDGEPVLKGQVVRVVTTGGGGWGDPLEREPELVQRDVIDDKVSLKAARQDYGVALTKRKGHYVVDDAKTARLRKQIKVRRKGKLPMIDRGLSRHRRRWRRRDRDAAAGTPSISGKPALDRVLPPIVTGSVACVIGIGLSKAALDMAFFGGGAYWGIALFTLVTTIGCSYLLQGKGFIGMLPVLLGATAGYVLTLIIEPGQISFANLAAAPLIAAPHLTLPDFTGPLVVTAIFSISIMALATIPESTAHLYQISLYVDRLADEQGRERVHLDKYVGWNLVFDGVGDVLHGLFGATAGTNYGENNSLMAITRNYSGPALLVAGVICLLLAFVGTLSAFVATIPVFVSGGLALYLFGVVGMQGIALMQENKVDLFDPLTLAVGATIMVIGIGGNIGFEGGFLPIKIPGIFPNGLPAIATAAVVGIVLNLVFRPIKERLDAATKPTAAE